MWSAFVVLDLAIMLYPAAVGALFGGAHFLVAIALHNKMAGGAGAPGSVAVPSFAKAVGITFTAALINAAAGVGVALAAKSTAAIEFVPAGGFGVLAQVVALPLSLLTMAVMLTAMLPTTFGRAVVITLLYLIITIALSLLIAVIVVVGMDAMRLATH